METGSASNDGGSEQRRLRRRDRGRSGSTHATVQKQHYATAQTILRDEAPVVPVEAFRGWALSRNGSGALPDGAGIMRYAGMTWSTTK